MKKLAYLLIYTLPITVYISFVSTGWLTFLPMITFFGLVPLFELFLQPDNENIDKKIAYDVKNQSFYDVILYLALPIQVGMLIFFLFIIQNTAFGSVDFFGRVTGMGLMCGVTGINVGHELGHRHKRWEQFIGEILLLTSLDTHFLPYHNGGHHKDVATPNDAASAAKNEWLYTFWVTSHFGSYAKAWKLENARLKRENKTAFSLNNRMVVYSIANVILIGSIYYSFGAFVLIAFLMAAVMGILLLETVNYIEHYGLVREENERGKPETVKHHHSWNSDHPLGRALLFNLSRHSDHHYNGSKKYQTLNSLEASPQMPTGYPGMVLLAVFQPLWFRVMNKKLAEIQS